MQFGFTLKPDHTIERTLALTRQAEAAGFELRLAVRLARPVARPLSAADADGRGDRAAAPRDLRDEPGDPRAERHGLALATLDEISGGRMDLGIGRGIRPGACLASRRHDGAYSRRRSASSGRWSPARRSSTRAPSSRFPGPGLDATGLGRRLRPDGHRDDRPRRGRDHPAARRPGPHPLVRGPAPRGLGRRRPDPPTRSRSRRPRRPTSARATCRERTRWFPALVSNHVVDLVNKYPREQLPESLTGYVRDRTGYDYHHHAEVGSSNAAFVGDEVTDRFCVLGGRRPDRQAARAAEAGVDQFNLYLMNGDEEAQLEAYGRTSSRAFL